jgi:hypothetical protein
LRRLTTPTLLSDAPPLDKGEFHEKAGTQALPKMDAMSTEDNSALRHKSDTLEGILEEQLEPVVSLLKQVENRSLAERINAPVIGA